MGVSVALSKVLVRCEVARKGFTSCYLTERYLYKNQNFNKLL